MELKIGEKVGRKIWDEHRVSVDETQKAWGIYLAYPAPRNSAYDSREDYDEPASWILVKVGKARILKIVWSTVEIELENGSLKEIAVPITAYQIDNRTKTTYSADGGTIYV